MNVKVEIEKEESWHRVLNIEVSAEDAEREYDKVAQRVAKKVKIKGFRQGKVPVTVVKKSFKAELDQEFLESVVPQAFGAALDETGLDPVTEPKFEELSFGEERPLSFKADFECRPQIDLKDYKGIEAEKQVPEVTDEHLESVLDDFRKSKAELEEVDRAAIDGDVLIVDYHGVDDAGEVIADRQVAGYTLELGAGRVVEQFEDALKGAAPGESRDAEIPYPEDYEDQELAGTTAKYRITVQKVQEKRFPTLDDALVKEHTEQETLAEFTEHVKKNLEDQADRAGIERLENILIDKVADANPFEAPGTLVDHLLEDPINRQKFEIAQSGGDPESVNEDQIRTEARASAERQVCRMLLLDEIARAEEIQVEDKELGEKPFYARVLKHATLETQPFLKAIRRDLEHFAAYEQQHVPNERFDVGERAADATDGVQRRRLGGVFFYVREVQQRGCERRTNLMSQRSRDFA